MDEITDWVTPLYAGLLGLLLIILAFRISRLPSYEKSTFSKRIAPPGGVTLR